MEYYWELIQHDGTRLEIPPNHVDTIKKRMTDGLPINTRSMTIPVNQVKYFRLTDKPFQTQNLLAEVAHAFNEPVVDEDGSIVCRWVKKQVTQQSFVKYYAPNGYRRLQDDGTMVTIAYRSPIHQIDQLSTPYCTVNEISQLERS
jgi:hypothetical protein